MDGIIGIRTANAVQIEETDERVSKPVGDPQSIRVKERGPNMRAFSLTANMQKKIAYHQ